MQAESDPQAIRAALVRQLASPVRWTDTIRKMAAQGWINVECGPGKVLAGLNNVSRDTQTLTIHDPASLSEARAALA